MTCFKLRSSIRSKRQRVHSQGLSAQPPEPEPEPEPEASVPALEPEPGDGRDEDGGKEDGGKEDGVADTEPQMVDYYRLARPAEPPGMVQHYGVAVGYASVAELEAAPVKELKAWMRRHGVGTAGLV